MKVIIIYETHHRVENYEKVDIFCPNCGLKDVWEEQGCGDYYVGPDCYCTSCENTFTILGPDKVSQHYQKVTLSQLQTGQTLVEPEQKLNTEINSGNADNKTK